MSVRGDFGKLDQLIKKMDRAGSGDLLRNLSRRLALAAVKQLADEFKDARDPYGKKWAALKLRRGIPLSDTGRLRTAATSPTIAKPNENGFRIVIPVKYAAAHQAKEFKSGGRTIRPVQAKLLRFKVRGYKGFFFARAVTVERRQMLPTEEDGGLGEIWGKAFRTEAEAAVREVFG